MTDCQKAAALARDLYAHKIDFNNFVSRVTGSDADEDISELIDLITHEPKSGGFLGVKKSQHDKYMMRIWSLIDKLEKEDNKPSNKGIQRIANKHGSR